MILIGGGSRYLFCVTPKEVLQAAVDSIKEALVRTQRVPSLHLVNKIRECHLLILEAAVSGYSKETSEETVNKRVQWDLVLARTVLDELKPGWNRKT